MEKIQSCATDTERRCPQPKLFLRSERCYIAPALALLNQVIFCQRGSVQVCAPRVLLSTAVNEQITAFTSKALLCGSPRFNLSLLLEAKRD